MKINKQIFSVFSDKKFYGEWGTVIGWGTTREGGSPAITLRETVLPIISNQQCVNSGHKGPRISSNMLCAGGYRGRDSCQVIYKSLKFNFVINL